MWAIRGVGPKTVADVEAEFGPAGALLELPVERWAGAIAWRGEAAELLSRWGVLARVADALEARCAASDQVPVFPGEAAWPALLPPSVAPPVLFLRGPGADAPLRRRIAVVGTRTLDPVTREAIAALAGGLAEAGLGVVSGAAFGADQAAHRGALKAKGETWAFLGSALDEIDPGQRAVSREILEGGGSLFSQFPPGCRSNPSTFTRRNVLISGASDAVLVCRAPASSGALYTAAAALEQGRPLLVTPGDFWCEDAEGSNELLQKGALAVRSAADVLAALGLEAPPERPAPPPPGPAELAALPEEARLVLRALEQGGLDFEALEAATGLRGAALSAALVQLDLAGALRQRLGRRYEKR